VAPEDPAPGPSHEKKPGAAGSAPGATSGEHEAGGGLGLSGKVLADRYRVESRLGQGGMASVYRASDMRLNRVVVVKVPHAALLVDPGFRKRFAAEVNNLAKLEHPNIIPIHDVGEQDGVPFAIVQFLRGGDLTDVTKEKGGRLTPEQVMEWLPRIADALDYVHGRGFLHRDVSPGNIIFDDYGNAHLSDFGIATAVSANNPDETEYSNLTKPGGFVGAATYSPPESIERKLNPGYDQYSLGVVVYEALCGQVPFERGSSEAMLVAKNTQPPAPLSEKVQGLPAGVVAAVMRAISKDPAKRFESSKAFTQAFQTGIEAAPMQQTPAALPTTVVVAPHLKQDLGTVQVDVGIHETPPRVPWLPITLGLGLLALAAATWVYRPWEGVSPRGLDLVRDTTVVTTRIPVQFTVGSSPAEQEAAYELCRKHLGDGCRREDYADEMQRTVTIGPIEIDGHEITNRDFATFVSETRYQTTAERQGFSWDPTFKGTGLSWAAPTRDAAYQDRPDHPVVHVSARDAAAYCEAQGKRLPTQDEWEFGARGEARATFPWGDQWQPNRAAFKTEGTRPVGSHPEGASWNGLEDMAGNVWEWTSSQTSQQAPIVKGGSWFEHDAALLRGAARMELADSEWTSADVGFRCVKDL
jgi:formylglycine-generating enzyme required for sulfatase activity